MIKKISPLQGRVFVKTKLPRFGSAGISEEKKLGEAEGRNNGRSPGGDGMGCVKIHYRVEEGPDLGEPKNP